MLVPYCKKMNTSNKLKFHRCSFSLSVLRGVQLEINKRPLTSTIIIWLPINEEIISLELNVFRKTGTFYATF